jgi:hypothetical protein
MIEKRSRKERCRRGGARDRFGGTDAPTVIARPAIITSYGLMSLKIANQRVMNTSPRCEMQSSSVFRSSVSVGAAGARARVGEWAWHTGFGRPTVSVTPSTLRCGGLGSCRACGSRLSLWSSDEAFPKRVDRGFEWCIFPCKPTTFT